MTIGNVATDASYNLRQVNVTKPFARRSVRVFVSSTFGGMEREREALARFVFPRLRHICERRDVRLFEVDLRWGITLEETAEGRVLELCLQQIDRCRPFFIGFLGSRYGWIDPEAAGRLAKFAPRLIPFADRSVTELEFRHAFLNPPEGVEPVQALVYLKAHNTDELDEECVFARDRLTALRSELRARECVTVDGYRDIQQLQEAVLAGLLAQIDALFPEGDTRDEVKIKGLSRLIAARRHEQGYVPRPKLEDALKAILASSRSQMVVVKGEHGIGKSALIANWWLACPVAPAANDTSPCLSDPIPNGWRSVIVRLWRYLRRLITPPRLPPAMLIDFAVDIGSKVDWEEPLRNMVGQLQSLVGVKQPLPTGRWALQPAFVRLLEIATRHYEITIVFDGLDEAFQDLDTIDLQWLPERLPSSARLVVSSARNQLVDVLHIHKSRIVNVAPLTTDERLRVIAAYLKPFGRKLSRRQAERIMLADRAGNPLYLRTTLEELRQHDVFESLDARIDYYLAADDTVDLFNRVLARLEQDFIEVGSATVPLIFLLLRQSRRGLSEREILDLLQITGSSISLQDWSAVQLAIEAYVANRDGVLAISHNSMAQAVDRRYRADRERDTDLRRTIVHYFSGLGAVKRAVDELPWQLIHLKAWNDLAQLLGDPIFLAALDRSNRYEARSYWTILQQNSAWRADLVYARIPKDTAASQCVMIAELLADLGYTRAALTMSAVGVDRLRQDQNPLELARGLSRHAVLLSLVGELEHAHDFQMELRHLIAAHQLIELDLSSRINLAMTLCTLGRFQEALGYLEEAEVRCRQDHDVINLAVILGNKGVALLSEGREREATAAFREQESAARRSGDLASLQAALGNLAAIERRRRRYPQALKLHREEEEICRQLGDKRGLHLCLGHQALVRIDQGHTDPALDLLTHKKQLAYEIEDKDALLTAEAYEALALAVAGQPLAAIRRAQDTLMSAQRQANLLMIKDVEAVVRRIERQIYSAD